jgi:signal transduction histidine kinase
VRDGQADAGCVRTSTLERMAREGKIDLTEFKVFHVPSAANHLLHEHHLLHSTVSYPEWPMAKLKHIDDVLALKVAKTLIDIPSDSHAAQSSYSFGWSVPLNYQSVHQCLRELKVEPYRDYGKFSLADVYRQYWLYILAVALVLFLFFSLFFRLKRLNINLRETVEKLDVELELRQKTEKMLQESSEKIKLFAYSVSHDLKSPAMALHGTTKLLAKKYRDRLDDKGAQYCDRIVSISEQINSLTEQINLYMSTKEQPIAPELINAKKIFQAIRQEYAGQLRERGIRWHESDLDVDIRADRLAMFRVFRNFIDNSLKYGGDFLSTIEISYEESDEAHIFSVKDDGVGLDPADCEKVFDPFQRSGTASGSKGSGLGLAIVKEIAELHRGEVWGEPAAEKGITFYFKIAKDL